MKRAQQTVNCTHLKETSHHHDHVPVLHSSMAKCFEPDARLLSSWTLTSCQLYKVTSGQQIQRATEIGKLFSRSCANFYLSANHEQDCEVHKC